MALEDEQAWREQAMPELNAALEAAIEAREACAHNSLERIAAAGAVERLMRALNTCERNLADIAKRAARPS